MTRFTIQPRLVGISPRKLPLLAVVIGVFLFIAIFNAHNEPKSASRKQTSDPSIIIKPQNEKSEKGKIRDKLLLDFKKSREKFDTSKKQKRLPDVIGIGAEKCGSGAISFMLTNHPMIHGPDGINSETHFFNEITNYAKGLEYYRQSFPEVYPDDIVFEMTPAYFSHRSADIPLLIKKDVPRAKLILVLCDPVNRTYSDFVHEIKCGKIREGESFEKFISIQMNLQTSIFHSASNDEDKITEHIFLNFVRDPMSHILSAGMYYNHLRRWLKTYKREEIHIVDGEELISNPGKVIEEIQDFLGIPKFIISEDFVRGPSGFYCQQVPTIWTQNGEDVVSLKKPSCMSETKGRTRKSGYKMSRNILQNLRTFHKTSNEKLFNLLNKRYRW